MKLAAHPFSPRIAQQSLDWLRMRVRYGCTAIFTPSALFPGISRRCTWRSVASFPVFSCGATAPYCRALRGLLCNVSLKNKHCTKK